MQNSGPISLTKQSNVVIRDLIISSSGDNGIALWECTNITIENCVIQNTAGNGVYTWKSNGVKVRNCTFKENASGVYISTGQSIIVENNRFTNVNGPSPRGQFVQFNGVTGSGNRISCNYMESITGQGNPEDAISTHNSYGTSSSPIIIENNYIKGGGPSDSGGGICLGDGGGAYIIARYNVLVNPGQYGMSIPAGNNLEISNNKIYAKSQYFTNVGISLWEYSSIDCGGGNKVVNNNVWWQNKNGVAMSFWTDNNCSNPTVSGNVWQSSQVSESMSPPSCAGTGSSTTTTSPPSSSVVYAGADQSISSSSTTLSGTVSNVSNIVAASWIKKSGGYVIIQNEHQGAVNPVNTQITGLQTGVYIFTLIVKDKSGIYHQDDVQITVGSTTSAGGSSSSSVVYAGPDQSISSTSATLSGTVNNVSNILAASWVKKSGGTVTISNPNQGAVSPVNTQVTGLQTGTYVFTLVARDKSNVYHQDDVQVTVNSSSTTTTSGAPVPNAGADKSITLPTNSTSLSGTVSNISNVAATSWTKKSGGSASISNPNQGSVSPVITQVTGLQAGAYVFTLVVRANNGTYYYDDIKVTVQSATSQAPVLMSGYGDTIAVDPNNGNLNQWNSVNAQARAKTDPVGRSISKPVVNIYPNPTESGITFRIETQEQGKSTIVIHDITGKAIMTESFVKTSPVFLKSMNLSKLAKGTYTAVVYVGEQGKVVQKVIKL